MILVAGLEVEGVRACRKPQDQSDGAVAGANTEKMRQCMSMSRFCRQWASAGRSLPSFMVFDATAADMEGMYLPSTP